MTEQINTAVVIEDITNIIKSELPLFWFEVFKYKMLGDDFLAIKIACTNYLINEVPGQRPQAVSLSLDLKTLELQPQVYGGNGGQKIYRNIDPNNPDEKWLAMKAVKIP